MSDNFTPITGVIVHMTKKAALVSIDGTNVWVPFSVIFEDDLAEMEVGDTSEINIADWFCEKEGL